MQNAGQLGGEIEGVVNAAVEPHAADRAVDVGGSPAAARGPAELFATRWYGIEVAAADIEIVLDAEELLQSLLQRFRPFQFVLSVVEVGREWMRSGCGGPFQ